MLSNGANVLAAVTATVEMVVPLWLPRSVTSTPPGAGSSSACSRDTDASAKVTSAVSERPSTWGLTMRWGTGVHGPRWNTTTTPVTSGRGAPGVDNTGPDSVTV